jgi:hypothetical protein
MLALGHNSLRFASSPATSPWANPLMMQSIEPDRLPGERHSDQTKLRALSVFAETGNQTQAAKTIGVDHSQVSQWVNSEEGATLVDDLRSTIRYNCGWQLAELVKRSIAGLGPAMDEGDATVLRSGQVVYTRPKFKDMVISASILIDKWMLISGAIAQSSAIVTGIHKLSDQMLAMGDGLAALSTLPNPPTVSPNSPALDPPTGENLLW